MTDNKDGRDAPALSSTLPSPFLFSALSSEALLRLRTLLFRLSGVHSILAEGEQAREDDLSALKCIIDSVGYIHIKQACKDNNAPLTGDELVFFAELRCMDALDDVLANASEDTSDIERVFEAAIALMYLAHPKGCEIIQSLCDGTYGEQHNCELDDDTVYFLVQDYIELMQDAEAVKVANDYLSRHPNNIMLG